MQMIILNLRWSLNQTEMEITYFDKPDSDIFQAIDRGHDSRMGFGMTPYCQHIEAFTKSRKMMQLNE